MVDKLLNEVGKHQIRNEDINLNMSRATTQLCINWYGLL